MSPLARSPVVLGVVGAVLATVFLAGPLLAAGAPPVLVALVVVGTALLVGGGGARNRRERDERQSVWALVPSWQYDGRHVESGGLTRDEQERALQDVQEQASRSERR